MTTAPEAALTVARLEEHELEEADTVFRLAFGTALGLPEPVRFAEGAELVRTRWRTDPEAAFRVVSDGRVVGCAFVARWGRSAVFGPLAVHPDWWGHGIARSLWEARLPLLDRWGSTHATLFTRVEPKNIHLYGSFGFTPGHLTALAARTVGPRSAHDTLLPTLAQLSPAERRRSVERCRGITDGLLPGLDLTREIEAVDAQDLGDTILLGEDGFAVCHADRGSEAGPGTCHVKFGCVGAGGGAAERFGRLLDGIESYASSRGLERVTTGVNAGRTEAYRIVLERGYRPFAFGVAMHWPGTGGYDRPDALVLADGR